MQTIYGSNGWDSYAWAFKAKLDAVTLVIHKTGAWRRTPPAARSSTAWPSARCTRPRCSVGTCSRTAGSRRGPISSPTRRGGARAAQHRGRPLPAARVDDRVVQGGQVRGRGALRGAAGTTRRGAGGRAGERAGAGGAHRARVELQVGLLRGRLPGRVHGEHGGRGVRGKGDRQGALRVQGDRRVQARRARLHGHRKPHPGRVPEHILPHEGGRHALWATHRRRVPRRPPQETGRRRAPPAVICKREPSSSSTAGIE
ncbi:hypothetical protein PR202_gb05569 [Eleusine coracana subsp. coracana]|uniref:DUF642 domain-containing protein n=1 Tax=Eleusine coracana subsp. coracana TaxID=191504 RepID=A0AAV5E7C8_ELECO|nr:hypothetical protein PR202_gb05569 [Eleusine coracana subsp. coracana]